ncbi:MAG TPA: hypothetical protein VFT59_03760 [Candidatus Saccharimonadales bacterium]|nr:hypothetical protein [Candidatus Saccharimonadales bacterium]
MSFLEGLNRFLQGKPVFEDPNASPAPTQAVSQEPASPVINKADERSFPVVRVEDVKSDIDGDRLRVYGEIKNEWHEEIMLDKIRLLNTVRELDSYLRANEQREFLLYDGPRPSRQYYEAQLDYKTRKEGDYFQAIHDVGFEYDGSDKTYSVDELRLRLPIRDIYG